MEDILTSKNNETKHDNITKRIKDLTIDNNKNLE